MHRPNYHPLEAGVSADADFIEQALATWDAIPEHEGGLVGAGANALLGPKFSPPEEARGPELAGTRAFFGGTGVSLPVIN